MNLHTLFFSTLGLAFTAGILQAEVKPNPLFTDGAVLQRGQTVPVWGTADDGEKVTVEIAGQKVSTTATNGKWQVNLEALEAGGPHHMKISGENVVEIKDILVGEVWVCSGQSNMEWRFKATDSADAERPKADFPEIRMFTVRRIASTVPLETLHGSWVVTTPKTVDAFSAVGYHFARALYEKIGVPVGMINSSWGGTPAQAWTSISGFDGHEELNDFAKISKANLGKSAEDFPKKRVGQGNPSSLFNGMIAPVIPYAIKGTIWYQGESNSGRSKQYRTLFPALIADWREQWGQGPFPFFFVQIAPFKDKPPEIREAQFLTLAKSENTAMVVTTDVGDANNIHPRKKKPVGERLALAARALVYGENIEYSGPLYEAMDVKGKEAVISFTHVGDGLIAKDGALKGFTIAGADGKFVPAKAEIKGATVVVSADEVSAPTAVRYGWENVPDVNLYNKQDLPASPFRTDVD